MPGQDRRGGTLWRWRVPGRHGAAGVRESMPVSQEIE
jgi:hypothetical protein